MEVREESMEVQEEAVQTSLKCFLYFIYWEGNELRRIHHRKIMFNL